MFRKEWNGASYLMHMAINRKAGDVGRKTVGGPYIKKEIVDALGIDPLEIDTTQELYDLAVQIKDKHFKDDNGKDISIIGPTAWADLIVISYRSFSFWTGISGEKFYEE